MTKSNVAFVCSLLAVVATLSLYWLGQGDTPLPPSPLAGWVRLLLVVTTLSFAGLLVWRIYDEVIVNQSDSALPPALFLLFCIGVPVITYTLSMAMCALPFFLLSQLLLFYGYQQSDIGRMMVISSFLVGISTLFVPLYALYFPMLWLGMYLCRCLTFRIWIASLLGMVTTYWITFGLTMIGVDIFPHTLFKGLLLDVSFVQIATLDTHLTTFVVVLSVLSIISMLYNAVRNSFNRVQTRLMCSYINYLWLYSLLLTVLYSRYATLFVPILVSCTAIQVGHSLRQLNSRYKPFFLLFLFALFILLNVWSF